MCVVITGASRGIGKETVKLFLSRGYTVYGLDIKKSNIEHPLYRHVVCDVSDASTLPDIENVEILVNNAGVWDPNADNIDVNLKGAMYCTEKYGLRRGIKSIVNVVSASAHSGAEFPAYVASKGGLLSYTKWTALEVAKYGATCNSVSPGGVRTESNAHILRNATLKLACLKETLLNRWAETKEIATWIYFVAVINHSMTAQDILIDNGEMAKATFVW